MFMGTHEEVVPHESYSGFKLVLDFNKGESLGLRRVYVVYSSPDYHEPNP